MNWIGKLAALGAAALLASTANCEADCADTLTCPQPGGGGSPGDGGGGGGTSEGGGGQGGAGLGSNGDPCEVGDACNSGHCVDEICCDAACDGDCVSCNIDGSVGICSPHPAANDPDGDCGAGTCDGAGNCASGDVLWAKWFGGAGSDKIEGVAADSAGSVVLVGHSETSIDFGGATHTTTYNAFVAKLDGNGDYDWSDSIGSSAGYESAQAVALGADDSIVVAGTYDTTITVASGDQLVANSNNDMFLAHYSASGTMDWAYGFGGSDYDNPIAVAFDSAVYLLSSTGNGVDFGGGAMFATGIHLAKRKPDGSHDWAQALGAFNAVDIALDPSGNVLLAGSYSSDLQLGSTILQVEEGDAQLLVAKFDPLGNVIWARGFGDATETQSAWGIAGGTDDEIWVIGQMRGVIDWGNGAETAALGYDPFLARLDKNGDHLWSATFGDASTEELNVATDALGNAIVGGIHFGTINIGGGPLNDAGNGDMFVGKIARDGTHLWSDSFGDVSADWLFGLAASPDGSVFAGGYYAGAITIGRTELPADNGSSAWLAHFGP